MPAPIVMISSYPPRLCGIGTFCEEAREFIQKANPDREVLVISHTDGQGRDVFPLIDSMSTRFTSITTPGASVTATPAS